MISRRAIFASLFAPAICLIWAGLSLGGSLIAAPAKFQVSGLGYDILLRIGRAQFDWLANVEWGLLALLAVGAALLPRREILLCLLPIIVFLVQRLFLMPQLTQRTTQILDGGTVPESAIHLVFASAEVLKCVLLIIAGMAVLALRLKSSSVDAPSQN